MPANVRVHFSGLALVHLVEQPDGKFMGDVHLLGECRDREARAPRPRPHIPRMVFPLACLVKDLGIPKGTRTVLDVSGNLLLEIDLDGTEVRLGADAGGGATIYVGGHGPTEPPDWKDVRYLLDLAVLSGTNECDHDRMHDLSPARVILDKGLVIGAEPRDPRMRDARWHVTDHEGSVLDRPILDRVCLEIPDDSTARFEIALVRDGKSNEFLLQEAGEFHPIPISIYALCDYAGAAFDEMDDVKQYEGLLKNPKAITVPTRKTADGPTTSESHSCPPAGLIIRKANGAS